MCDKQCAGKKVSSSTTSQRLWWNGKPHTMNFCEDCNNLRQAERKEPRVSGKRWRITVGAKSSLGANYPPAWGQTDSKTRCGNAALPIKMHAKNLLSEAATAFQQPGRSWPEESPCREELVLLRERGGLHLARTTVRQAMKAGEENDEGGGWSEFLKSKGVNAQTGPPARPFRFNDAPQPTKIQRTRPPERGNKIGIWGGKHE